MTERPPLLAEKLGFFGAVTASLSHELKNVLATINELGGLMDDQLVAAGQGRPLRPERLERACANIEAQVYRGSTLVERLNRFAHIVDHPEAQVDPREVVARIAEICRRLATLKNVKLEQQLAAGIGERRLDPFALQHVIFLCLRAALEAAAERRVITVCFAPAAAGGEGFVVAVQSADPLGELGEALLQDPLLLGLAGELRATLALEHGPDRVVLTCG